LKGQLWFGTDRGVVCWNGREMQVFTTSQGLAGQEVNRAALLQVSDGNIWIGTNGGLSSYNQRLDILSRQGGSPAPILRLLYLETVNQQYPLTSPVSLAAMDNTLTFHFRGISFVDEKAIRFKTSLQGYEES